MVPHKMPMLRHCYAKAEGKSIISLKCKPKSPRASHAQSPQYGTSYSLNLIAQHFVENQNKQTKSVYETTDSDQSHLNGMNM